jgi:uncharacterized lipoprotein YmbA
MTALLGIVGCTLGGRSAPIQYYVLKPLAEAVSTQAPSTSTLGVGPVVIPQYLDRTGIVSRKGGSELAVDERARWAEPLDEMLARTIAENLVRLTGSPRVFAYPWTRDIAFDQRVYVRIVQFEIGDDGAAHLVCQWQHSKGDAEPMLVRSSLRASPSGSSTDAQVAALSDTVASLSREIAEAVARR